MQYNYDPSAFVTDQGAFLIPYLPRDVLMVGPWFSCLQVSMRQPEVMQAFRAETGCTYTLPTSPIEQMIDQSTFHEKTFLATFAQWFNVNVWGDLDLTVGTPTEDAGA